MANQLFRNVKAITGNEPVSKGWKYLAVKKAQWVPIKSGDHRGEPRLALQITVVEPLSEEGSTLFDGGVFTSEKSTGILRNRLETIAPDVDWGNFAFPESFDDADGKQRLSDALVGAEFYALVTHKADERDPTAPMRAQISRVAPRDAGIEILDPLDVAA